MTLSLYSTYKAWRREAAAEKAARSAGTDTPPVSQAYRALVLLGLGLGGIACGDDEPPDGVNQT
jgi:hypothetical protein